jgi:hypothetical protein
MASKDIGDERWTINLNLAEPASESVLSATGNVFRAAGEPPAFVYCELRSDSAGSLRDPSSFFRFSCRGAPPCHDMPDECAANDWSLIGEDIEVRADFFLPDAGLGEFGDGTSRARAGESALLAGTVRWLTVLGSLPRVITSWLTADGNDVLADFLAANAQAADRARPRSNSRAFDVSSERGATLTPDRRIHLVSKDVGADRWSIAATPILIEERSRLAVTGNVYRPDGSPPRFVYCLERADSRGSLGEPSSFLRFSCQGAGTCRDSAADCAAHSWTLISDALELPASFLLPPTPTVTPSPTPTSFITVGPTPQATPSPTHTAPPPTVVITIGPTPTPVQEPSAVVTIGPTPQGTPTPLITLGATPVPTPGLTPSPQPTPSPSFITLGPTPTPPLPSATPGSPP